jgi:hypothetical protein
MEAPENFAAKLALPLQAIPLLDEPSKAKLFICAAIAVLLVAVTSLLYARRPLEKTGSAMAFGFWKRLFAFSAL